MKQKELNEILRLHQMWLNKEGDGVRANLRKANLSKADLTGANLQDANLQDANLQDAKLYCTNLEGADLQGAYLHGADLSGADLTNTTLPPICFLPEGDILGWKKLKNGTILKLLIPKEARRINSTSRKCRAEFVDVIEVFGELGPSRHNEDFIYKLGRIYPDSYNHDFREECTNGIHFFITRTEAEEY